jgi:hypothetical protein
MKVQHNDVYPSSEKWSYFCKGVEVLQAHTDRSTARHPYSSIYNYGKTGIWPKFTNIIFVETQRDTYKRHSPVYLNRQYRNPLTFKEIKLSNFL